jgi:diguanylate cyclase (GGDEF)-like protein
VFLSTEHLSNLPSLVAMLILITALLILQRRNPRIVIGSWLLALGLIFSSQVSWYFTWFGTPYYAGAHTFRLCVDLLTGIVLLLFTGRPLSKTPHSLLRLVWNAAAFIALECLYGMDVVRPMPYFICAAAGAGISVLVAARLRRIWTIPASQVIVWLGVAFFSARGNYRASAYLGLAAVYAAAALHLWFRLRRGSLGRIGIVASLGMWAASFLAHPWVFSLPRYRAFADEIWDLQKFFITAAMLMFLLEEEIGENAQLAYHDQLTGLPNRRLMEQRLMATIGHGRATVLLMDLDGFKGINDSLGHLAGDEVLRQIAFRLNPILHANETLVRLGGDEFLIVSTRDPGALMESIHASLRKPVILESGIELEVRLSIGSSTFPEDAQQATGREAIRHLLRAADLRMYGLKSDRQLRRPDADAHDRRADVRP